MSILFNKITLKILSILSIVEGIAMIFCSFLGMSMEEWTASKHLINIGVGLACIGTIAFLLLRNRKITLKSRDGYIITSIVWIYSSLIGSLPYICYGYPVSSSIFDTVAGFTTTGCTVLDINTMPHALILWKAVTNWLGGMGVLVLIITMFSALGINAKSLASSESTANIKESMGSRFSDTGKFLYLTYTLFTVLEFICLLFSPLSPFDALVNTLSTISTSGVNITVENADAFDSDYTRAIILIFTILTSLNYYLYYYLFKGKWKSLLKNLEVRVFVTIIIISSVLIALCLRFQGSYTSFGKAIWDALFQVVSFISTAGYPVISYIDWPMFTIMLLFSLVLIGGCSMSTSGSLKVIRVITMFKIIQRRIFKQVHPHGVRPIKVDGKPISAEKVSDITTHILLFFSVIIVSCITLSFNNLDIGTTITTVIGLFTTTGLSLGTAGATGFFGFFSPVSLYLLSLLMIIGRIEMYAIILLFTKSFWQADKANSI